MLCKKHICWKKNLPACTFIIGRFQSYYASGTGSKPTNNKCSIAETTQGNLDNTESKIFDTNGKYVRHLCKRETLLTGRSFNPTLYKTENS